MAGGASPSELMDAHIPILPTSQCRALLGTLVTDHMLCAGLLRGGVDSCQVRAEGFKILGLKSSG
jgi:hypothetical protein